MHSITKLRQQRITYCFYTNGSTKRYVQLLELNVLVVLFDKMLYSFSAL